MGHINLASFLKASNIRHIGSECRSNQAIVHANHCLTADYFVNKAALTTHIWALGEISALRPQILIFSTAILSHLSLPGAVGSQFNAPASSSLGIGWRD